MKQVDRVAIEREGYLAAVDGIHKFENPYGIGRAGHGAWRVGWERAHIAGENQPATCRSREEFQALRHS